jgi:sodium transport system permease protein
MNLRNIFTIYRKELLETLRDRKTLIFMLVLPTVIMPLAMIGLSKFAIRTAGQRAMEEVVIAADKESQANYYYLAQQQFLDTAIGRALRYTTHPLAKLLIPDNGARALLNEVPREIFRDPMAYADWAHGLAERAEEVAQNPAQAAEQLEQAAQPTEPMSPDHGAVASSLSMAVADSFLTTIQSVGLVNFVEPSQLNASTSDVPTTLPAPLGELPNGRQVAASIRDREITGYLEIHGDVRQLAQNTESASLRFYYNSTLPSSDETANRIRRMVSGANNAIVKKRLFEKGLPEEFLHPVRMTEETNLATASQQVFSLLGGLLPYLVLTFTYLGGFYPAIDLAAGEKERHTLETLLLTPMSRLDIALGKFLVLFTTSLTAAVLGIVSLTVSLWLVVPAGIIDQLQIHVDPLALLSISLLAIPPAGIFAGVFLSISIYARSFKEAQNYMAPLGLFALLPAAAAMIPGVEMNWKTAMIPFVNLSLLGRDFLKGDINWGFYFITLGVSVLLAAIALALSAWQFQREEVLFRS